jgi:hypothetical protein
MDRVVETQNIKTDRRQAVQSFADCAVCPQWACEIRSWNHLLVFCPGWLDTESAESH